MDKQTLALHANHKCNQSCVAAITAPQSDTGEDDNER
jgi:hypothetical protein